MRPFLIGICPALLYVVACVVAVVMLIDSVPARSDYLRKDLGANSMAKLLAQNNLQKYGVDMIGSSDSTFRSTLSEVLNVQEIAVEPIVNLASPLAVVISNKSNKNVVGCSLRWEFSRSDGTKMLIPQFQSSPGVLMGRLLNPEELKSTTLIPSGEKRIFSFDYDLQVILTNLSFENLSNENRNERLRSTIEQFGQQSEAKKTAILAPIDSLSVSIDGIFFDDGVFVGEDSLFYFEFMRGQIQAHGEVRQVLSNFSPGEDLVSRLPPITLPNRSPKLGPWIAQSGLDAFERGYQSRLNSLTKEISRKVSDGNTAIRVREFLEKHSPESIKIKRIRGAHEGGSDE